MPPTALPAHTARLPAPCSAPLAAAVTAPQAGCRAACPCSAPPSPGLTDRAVVPPGYRKGSDEDKAANYAIWEDAERRLWADPDLDIGKDWFVNSYSIGEKGIDEDVLVCSPKRMMGFYLKPIIYIVI